MKVLLLGFILLNIIATLALLTEDSASETDPDDEPW